jgi:hypothetical protein
MKTTMYLERDDIAVYSEVLWEDELGVEGSDQWVRFWSHESDITPDEIYKLVFPMVYRQTYAPAGGYFCTSMRVFQTDHLNEVICVIHHRYDV